MYVTETFNSVLFPYERMLQKKFIINPLAFQIYLPFAVTLKTVMKRQTLVPCLVTREPSRQPPAGTSSRMLNFTVFESHRFQVNIAFYCVDKH